MSKLPKLKAPNYTQVPNLILDEWMPLLDPSLFKIVMYIARKTFGWRVGKDKMSLTQISEGTGISRRSVIDHIQNGLELGALAREVIPGTNEYCYFLPIENVLDTPSPGGKCKSCTPPYAESALTPPQNISTSANSALPPSANSALPPQAVAPPPPYYSKETLSKETSSSSPPPSTCEDPVYSIEEEEEFEKVMKKREEKGEPPLHSPEAYKRRVIEKYREGRGAERDKAVRKENFEELIARRREKARTWPLFAYEDGLSVRVTPTSVEICTDRGCQAFGYNLPKDDWNALMSFLASKAKGPGEVTA